MTTEHDNDNRVITLDDDDEPYSIILDEHGQMKCDVCSTVFKSKARFIQHEKRHFTMDHFICTTCSKGFTKFSQCMAHELREHNIGGGKSGRDRDLEAESVSIVPSTSLYPYRGPPVVGAFEPYEIELKYSRSERKSYSSIVAKYTLDCQKKIAEFRNEENIEVAKPATPSPKSANKSPTCRKRRKSHYTVRTDNDQTSEDDDQEPEYLPNYLKSNKNKKTSTKSTATGRKLRKLTERKWYFCSICSYEAGFSFFEITQHRRLKHPENLMSEVAAFKWKQHNSEIIVTPSEPQPQHTSTVTAPVPESPSQRPSSEKAPSTIEQRSSTSTASNSEQRRCLTGKAPDSLRQSNSIEKVTEPKQDPFSTEKSSESQPIHISTDKVLESQPKRKRTTSKKTKRSKKKTKPSPTSNEDSDDFQDKAQAKKLKRRKIYRRVWERLRKPVKRHEFISALDLVEKTDVIIGSRRGSAAVVSSLYRRRKGRRERSHSPHAQVTLKKMTNTSHRYYKLCQLCDFYAPTTEDILRHSSEAHLGQENGTNSRKQKGKEPVPGTSKSCMVSASPGPAPVSSTSESSPKKRRKVVAPIWCRFCGYYCHATEELRAHTQLKHKGME